MFEKLENSWKLAKECWRVLMLDKEMLMFPVFSIITTLVVTALVVYPLWAMGFFEPNQTVHVDVNKIFDLSTVIKYALLSIIPTYIGYVILTFFNAGLITCAFIRLCGDDPVLADGFRIAWKRLPQILTWSMIAATVGLVLRLIKGRNNFIGSMVSGMIGFGWRIASFFAIPVIVAEEKGAIDALKRSGQLVKKNWGEAITLEVGLSVLAIPATLPFFLMVGLATSVWATAPALGISLIVIGIVYVFLVSLVFSTLDAIAKAALYMFASGDQMPVGFNNEILENIFKRNGVGSPALA